MKFEWELIEGIDGDSCKVRTSRAKVIGGWVLNTATIQYKDDEKEWIATSESNVFIPDPEHKWEIEHELD